MASNGQPSLARQAGLSRHKQVLKLAPRCGKRLLRPSDQVWLAVVIAGVLMGASGCSALQERMTRRSEKCSSLCDQARKAQEQGWPDQAELLLNEALNNRPKDAGTRRQLAEALWRGGRQDDALAELSALVQLHPRDAKLRSQQATFLFENKNLTAAALAAEHALRLDPNSIDALFVKARVDSARGELEPALASYILLTQLAPDRLDAKLELAEVHIRRGNADQACPLLRDATQQPQANREQLADAEWRLGLGYAAAERWADAAATLGRAIEHRNATELDWECLATVRAFAGEDIGGVQAMARMASANQPATESKSLWTELRNQLATRDLAVRRAGDSPTQAFARDGVVPADFSRTASVNESRSMGRSR